MYTDQRFFNDEYEYVIRIKAKTYRFLSTYKVYMHCV